MNIARAIKLAARAVPERSNFCLFVLCVSLLSFSRWRVCCALAPGTPARELHALVNSWGGASPRPNDCDETILTSVKQRTSTDTGCTVDVVR